MSPEIHHLDDGNTMEERTKYIPPPMRERGILGSGTDRPRTINNGNRHSNNKNLSWQNPRQGGGWTGENDKKNDRSWFGDSRPAVMEPRIGENEHYSNRATDRVGGRGGGGIDQGRTRNRNPRANSHGMNTNMGFGQDGNQRFDQGGERVGRDGNKEGFGQDLQIAEGIKKGQRFEDTGTGNRWVGGDVRDSRRRQKESESEIFGDVGSHTTGINFDSYDNIPVDVSGWGAQNIKPIESFQSIEGVNPLLMANIERVRYTKPTPIQKYAIPVILMGRDLMACAQTGSGKTAAFLFPILVKMLNTVAPPLFEETRGNSSARRPPATPQCLVLAPTRELALQIYNEARKFQYQTNIKTVALYGGSDVFTQCRDLGKGCRICVATPGRLNDMLGRKTIKVSQVSYLVMDEADRMLDMGFAPQIREIVEHNDMPKSNNGRQTVMFSATFPREIQQLATDFLSNYIYLAIGRVGSTNDFIKQKLVYADEDQKMKQLTTLLNEQEKGLTIIFVETKRRADRIEDFLIHMEYPAVSIHGDRSQQEREEALRLFKNGSRPILVATDVAARGLDISNVVHVINCDLPSNIDDYVHRIGRTGRAGNYGLATSFVNEHSKPILKDLFGILKECNQEVPKWFPGLVQCATGSRPDPTNRSNKGRTHRYAPREDNRDIRGDHPSYPQNTQQESQWRSSGRFDDRKDRLAVKKTENNWNNPGFEDAW